MKLFFRYLWVFTFAFFVVNEIASQTCTVNSGNPEEFCENGSIYLNGTVSILNGDPSSVLWTVISQPMGANIIINNPNQPESSTSGTIVSGDYTFQIQQTCSDTSGTPSQQVTHTVNPLPTQAALPATIDSTCYDGNTSILIAGNTPAMGETVTWKIISGYDGTLTNANSSTVSFDPILNQRDCEEGDYHTTTLRYTISNGDCTTFDDVVVRYYYTVNSIYATAIPDNICGSPGCTDLYGACSLDGTGLWTATGPGNVTFSNPTEAYTRACVDAEGTYTFTWTVTGGCRPGVGSDTASFTGFGAGLTTTDAGPTQYYCDFPSTISLNATPLENGQTGLWSQLDGLPVTINNNTSPSTVVMGLQKGGGPYLFAWELFGTECSVYDTVRIIEKPDIVGYARNLKRCYTNQTGSWAFQIDALKKSDIDTLIFQTTPTQSIAINPTQYSIQAYVYEDKPSFPASFFGYCQFRNVASTTYVIGGDLTVVIDSTWLADNIGSCGEYIVFAIVIGTRDPGTYGMDISVSDGCETQSWSSLEKVGANGATIPNAGTDALLPCGVTTVQLSGNNLTTSGSGFAGQWNFITGPMDPFNDTARHQQTPILTGLTEGTYVFSYGWQTHGACDAEADEVTIVVNTGAPDTLIATVLTTTPCAAGPVQISANLPDNAASGAWTQISPTKTTEKIYPDTSSTYITLDNLVANTNYTYRWEVFNNCDTTHVDVTFSTGSVAGPSPAVLKDEYICYPAASTVDVQHVAVTSGTVTWTTLSMPSDDTSSPTFTSLTDSTTRVSSVEHAGVYEIEYKITGDSSCSSTTIDTIYLIYDYPVWFVEAGEDAQLCGVSFPYTMQLQGDTSRQEYVTSYWRLAAGPEAVIFADSSNNDSTVTFNGPGTYILEWRHFIYEACQTNSDFVTIEISGDAGPLADAGADSTMCGSDGVFNLNGNAYTAPDTAIWSIVSSTGSSVTFSNKNNPTSTASLSKPGEVVLRWTVFDSVGFCPPNQDEVILTWLLADASATDTSLCDVTSTTLIGNEVDDIADVKWSQVSGPNTPTIADDSASITVVSGLTSGTYEFEYKVSYHPDSLNPSCIARDTVAITITSFVQANAGVDTVVCGGSTVNLSAGNAGGNWSLISGTNSGTFGDTTAQNTTYGPLTADSSYIFRYTIGNGACVSNDNVVAYILEDWLLSSTDTTSTCGNSDGVVDLIVRGGSGGLSFLWSNGATTEDLAVAAGTYSVTVTAPGGCTATYTTIITNSDGPTATFATNPDPPCPGENFIITATGSGGSGSGYTFLWDDSTSTANRTVNTLNDTTYYVTVTDGDNCSSPVEAPVTLAIPPMVDLGPDTNVCSGSAITLIPTVSPIEYGTSFYTEGFESGLGNWVQATGDDGNWSRDSGGTPSSSTGPSTGANGSTWYLFQETSGGSTGDQVILESSRFDLTGRQYTTLSFYYHMYGASMGTLSVEVSTDSTIWSQIWSLSSNQGDQWFEANVDLSTYDGVDSLYLRFISARGTSFQGDAAIDDISLREQSYSYSWSTLDTTTTISVNPSNTTKYYLTVTDANGCEIVDSVSVEAGEGCCPAVNNLITDRFICTGELVDTLAVTTTVENPDSIAFVYFTMPQTDSSIIYSNGTGIDTVQVSATSDTVGIYNISGFTNAGSIPDTFYVYAIIHPKPTSNLCLLYEEILIVVNPLPSITGRDTSICGGQNIDLGTLLTGDTIGMVGYGTTYGDYSGNQTVSPTITTTYFIKDSIENAGCVDTAQITITVSNPSITGRDTAICSGESVDLGTLLNGDTIGTVGYGTTFGNYTGSQTVSPTSTTTYFVRDSAESLGCVDTAQITITVSNPSITGRDTAICSGESVDLGTLLNGDTIGTVGYGTTFGNYTGSQTVSPTSTTTYFVRDSAESLGCVDTAQITITVSNPSITGRDTAICSGESVDLGTLLNGDTIGTVGYGTTFGNYTGSQTVSPTSTTTYFVRDSAESLGCVDTAQIVVTVTAPFITGRDTTICSTETVDLATLLTGTIIGTVGYGITFGNYTGGQVVSPTTTTTYYVRDSVASGCVDTAKIMVMVNPQPAITGRDTSICTGESVDLGTLLTGDTIGTVGYGTTYGDYTSSQMVNPTNTTTYFIRDSVEMTGCVDTAILTVTVIETPNLSTRDTTICAGESVDLAVLTDDLNNSAGSETYHTALPTSTGNRLASSTVAPSANTKYYVSKGIGDCSDVDSITVSIAALPMVIASNDTTICNGDTATLSAVGSDGTSPYSYAWNNGLGTGANKTATPGTTTTYTVTITDANGCTDTDQVAVTVADVPQGTCIISQDSSSIAKDTTVCGGNQTSTGTGTNWTMPPGSLTSNDGDSTHITLSGDSDSLDITGQDWNIPTTAIIEGIEITIRKKEGDLSNGKKIQDKIVQLLDSSLAVGANLALTGDWPVSEGTFTYGGANSLWGYSWTGSNINDLGLRIQVTTSGGGKDERADIDQVCIKIYYTIPPTYCDTDSGLSFSVSGVTGATSYSWTIPTGATISSGDGTSSITVNFNNAVAAGSQQVCVTPNNSCGNVSQCCITFQVLDCAPPCFDIDSLLSDRIICSGESVDTLAVTTTSSNPDSIAFVYFTTQQTDSSVIYSSGTGIDTVQIANGNDTVRIFNLNNFTNTSNTPDTFYVYAIAHPTPSDNTCRPYDEIKVIVYACDWGDLPDTTAMTNSGDYQTFNANGGAVHQIIPELKLGSTIDGETDGQPSTNALGDGADEDGVAILSSLNIRPGGTFRLPLKATNITGDTAHLEAWIDWNGDGDFDDIGEMVIDIDDLSGFPAYLEITAPANIQTGGLLGLRVRLSNTNNMTPYGQINEGEVEDYLIGVDCPQVCLPVKTEAMRKK